MALERRLIGCARLNVKRSKAGFSVAELADAGVKRISVGATFARIAYGEVIRAAKQILGQGTLGFTDNAMGFAELSGDFTKAD